MRNRIIDDPQPGYFKVRLVKGGPLVPARIARTCRCTIGGDVPHDWTPDCDRWPPLSGIVNGVESGRDTAVAIWNGAREVITKAEYDFLLADAQWAAEFAPSDPKSDPRKAVNWLEMEV